MNLKIHDHVSKKSKTIVETALERVPQFQVINLQKIFQLTEKRPAPSLIMYVVWLIWRFISK